jgi:hypothetical protein
MPTSKKQTGKVFYPDGDTKIIHPLDKKEFQLSELQKIVGGCIELIRVGREYLYVNEDGIRLNLVHNKKASAILGPLYSIVGMAVLVTPASR